jgi:nucleotide-binding universal stress UspA family protein
MIKHILVPTDGSDTSMMGVRYAIAMAHHHGATIHGLHVVDVRLLEGPFLHDLSASLGTAPYVNCQGQIAMLLEERGRAALEACRQGDMLVTLAVFAPLGKTIAEICGIPLILVEPTPVLPTGDFPAPGWSLFSSWSFSSNSSRGRLYVNS